MVHCLQKIQYADPKLTGLDRSEGSDVVIFENRGLDLLSRRHGTSSQASAAATLISQYNWGALVVLRGTEGVTMYRELSRYGSHSPAASAAVACTTV